MREAEHLTKLSKIYSDFKEMNGKKRNDLSQMFGSWFNRGEPSSADSIFLYAVEDCVKQLVDSISGMSAVERQSAAEGAADILLAPKPREQNSYDWTLTAAEFSVFPLLPHLSNDAIIRLRDSYVSRIPKRMMLPRQRSFAALWNH